MTTPRPHSLPARVLTLDQAYSFAYGELRRRLTAFADSEPDMVRRGQLLDVLDDVAARLTIDLSSLLLGDHLAHQLARPE